MRDRHSFELDLAMTIDNWSSGLYGEGLDHVSQHNLDILIGRILKLHDIYSCNDQEVDAMLHNDSLGG